MAETGSDRTGRYGRSWLRRLLPANCYLATAGSLSAFSRVVFALSVLVAPAAMASDYPSRAIKIIVPLAAGGGTDTLARILGQELSEAFGQPVVIENRPGAGTQIGAGEVARAAPDGYTLLASSLTTFAINPSLYSKLPYDPLSDFVPVSLTGRFAFVLIANPSFKAKTLPELIALAKEHPSTINFASAGQGSPHHLSMELLAERAGISLVHVPYKGAAPALNDLIGGHVPLMLTDYSSARQAIEAGLVHVLAVASPQRLAALPDTPTVAESGFAGFDTSAWQGIVAPRGTPAAIVAKLNETIAKVLSKPELVRRLREIAIEPIYSSPTEFSSYMREETAKWGRIIRMSKVTIE